MADLFLTEGLLGASETRRARTAYPAGPDALFDPSRVAVLVDGTTAGTAEWLAAVLRRGGATLVGGTTAGEPYLYGRVTVPGWELELSLATGWMLAPGGDGAPPTEPMGRVRPDRFVRDAERVVDVARELLAPLRSSF